MDPLQKNVKKQLIVRTFEPDMAALKQTAKQVAAIDGITLNLYGQSGEVLIVASVQAIADAAATELTEAVAKQFEAALGDSVYGRGKGSLAYFTAGELIENECLIAASDSKTGALLAEEFSHTKRGNSVFDFGDSSYNDSRVMAKIKTEAAKHCEPGDSAQMAAARAAAAAKCSRADVGVSIVGSGEKNVYLAVYYKGYVYLRKFSPAPDSGKKAALAALDITRRLMQKLEPNARVFKANTNFDWDAPVQKKAANPYLAPVIILVVLLVALAVACWYFFTHFSLGGQEGDALAVSGTSSVSQSADSGSASSVPAGGVSDGGQTDAAGSIPAAEPEAPASTTPPAPDSTGTVHPFA